MGKDYTKWHQLKSGIEDKDFIPQFWEREIWWCALGSNVGVEIDGRNRLYERPVIVLRKFNKYMFWAVPLTTKVKTGKLYYSFYHNYQYETVVLFQMRLISSKRLLRRMGRVNKREHIIIRQLVTEL